MAMIRQFDPDAALATAMSRFWRHGYEATSIQDLVDCTHVNRGSLYGTWGDKRGLFVAALKAYDSGVRAASMRQAAASLPPLEAIRAILSTFAAQAANPADAVGCMLTNTALERAPHDPEIRAMVAAGQRDAERILRSLVEAARTAGDLPADLDPVAAGRRLLATLAGLAVLVRSQPDPALLAAIVDDAITTLVPVTLHRPPRTPEG